MVSGKLHNERSGIAREGFRLFQDNTRDNDCAHTEEVCGGGYPPRAAEHDARDHGDERYFRAAGDKRSGHDRHTSVAFAFDRTGSHDAGDTATRADEHGDEGFTG